MIFGILLATVVSLNPTNVVVECPGETLNLSPRGTVWEFGSTVVVLATDGSVELKSPERPVLGVRIDYDCSVLRAGGVRFYCDAWERTYGTSGWVTPNADSPLFLPWYTLVRRKDVTDGIGVRVQPGAFAAWCVESGALSLLLDVRAGSEPVELGPRSLVLCRVVSRLGERGENAFDAARAFARVMCPTPRLPKEPVYGYNDWYCSYGNSRATDFLADAAVIVGCAKGLEVRPYVVADDGWQNAITREGNPKDGGQWRRATPRFGMEMPEFVRRIKEMDAKPGLWYRPFAPDEARTGNDLDVLPIDPTDPVWEKRIRDDIETMTGWGVELIKIDFLTYDWNASWCNERTASPVIKRLKPWRDRSRTTAEVIRGHYALMRMAAGDRAVIVGCNAINHLAAGLFELQRIGDDTSGLEWKRTERMGVNTIAMRFHQDGTFFSIDADCVGLARKGNVPWVRNRQWLDLIGRTGSALFVSWLRELATPEVRSEITAAFKRVAEGGCDPEPLDWTDTLTPRNWRFGSQVKTYDWQTEGDGEGD